MNFTEFNFLKIDAAYFKFMESGLAASRVLVYVIVCGTQGRRSLKSFERVDD